MSNIFEEVKTNAVGIEQKLLGPDYPYWENIKDPKALGMSDEGSLQTMAKDIDGLIQYVEVLVTGKGASKTGGPLGNKFFLQTGGKCKDVKTGQEVDRYVYINNVPMGNIPFISSGLGTNFSDFKGLIPGTMGNLNVLNPFTILSSFTSGATPDCQEITMQVVGPTPPGSGQALGPNATGTETHFVTTVDIGNMDPCNWVNGKQNPVTGKSCQEMFGTMYSNNSALDFDFDFPRDPIIQLYLASLGILGIYILYCLMMKHRRR
uniref:Uncharacterized protein n=1 Tax=viral metagenome TaxID=1070528 RepID=A0A6C0B1D8_9ZZZZ